MTLKDLHEMCVDGGDEARRRAQNEALLERVGRMIAVFEKFASEESIEDSDAAVRRDLEFLDELIDVYRG